mgnify:CR=1 FL=1
MRKIILAITLALLQLGYAQSEKEALKKAAQYYKNLDYVQAINLLKFIKDQVKDSIDLKLGTLFYSSCSFHAYKKDLVDHVF